MMSSDVTVGAEIIAAEDLCKDFKIAAGNSKVRSKGEESIMMINSLGKASDSDCRELKDADTVLSKSHIQFSSLSNFVQHVDSKKDGNITVTMMKPVQIMPKPRTALFQGGEDDENMAPQIIPACHTPLASQFIRAREDINYLTMRFGEFSIDMKQTKMAQAAELDATLQLPSRTFVGNNLRKKLLDDRASNIFVQKIAGLT
jgi:hypothetical protein